MNSRRDEDVQRYPQRKPLSEYKSWDEYFQAEIVPQFEDRQNLPPINLGYQNLKRR